MSFYKKRIKKIFQKAKLHLSLFVFYLSQTVEESGTNPATNNNEGIQALFSRVANIVNFCLTLLVPIAVIALIIAGFQYITSGGNPEIMQKAKTNLLWIVIGMLAIVGAKSLIILVLSTLGINYSLFGL
ncbi:TrbC/VirB2 family protein [bacterium]|nr:TrbC/VirB2 family protein [bacterium]